jgi:hypothetical protein
MKRITFTLILFFFSLNNNLFSQFEVEKEPMLTLAEKDFVFSGFLGLPNWGTFFLDNHFLDDRVSNASSSGITPLSLEMEYFFTDRISGTFTGIYNTWGGTWTEQVIDDNSGLNIEQEHNFSFDVTRLRFLVGINYHYYDFNIENVDLYVGFALGANSLYPSFTSTLDGWRPQNVNYYNEVEGDLEFPLAYRLRAGMKYFITDKIGMNLEVGVGGATFNLGLNYKL